MDTEQTENHAKGKEYKKMTSYGRSYSAPIFHIADADKEQIELMETVFDTLDNSGIEFVEVRREEDKNTIAIITHGSFTHEEQAEILAEVHEIYGTE